MTLTNNQDPGEKRRLIVGLMLVLAVALLSQRVRAQEADGGFSKEQFVPGSARFAAGATMALRSDATVVGTEVTLKQVCRWSAADAPVFTPIADLVILRISPNMPFRAVAIDEIKDILRDAGVNLAAINIVGAGSCTVTRTDVQYDEATALADWAKAKQAGKAGVSGAPTTAPTAATAAALGVPPAYGEPVAASTEGGPRTLRQALIADLATRVNLPVEVLQMTFRPQDEPTLKLVEPRFQFDIEAVRARDLGDVAWNVKIIHDGVVQKAPITATARAWQQQVMVAKVLASGQVVKDEDVIERRTLVDRLPDSPLLNRSQIVGQQAARDLKPGTLVTSRLVDPVILIRPGQFVTVTVKRGAIEVKTVARAMEQGSMGQSIKVKNEANRDIYDVIISGPQTATMGGNVAGAQQTADLPRD